MFNRHLVIDNGSEQNLYLYVDNYYEFSSELLNSKVRKNIMFDMINKYIKLKKINFNGNKIFLVYNGIVIAYVLTNNIDLNSPNDIIHYEYVEKLRNYYNDDNTELIKELIDNYIDIRK